MKSYYEVVVCPHGYSQSHPIPGTERPHDDGSPGWERDMCEEGSRRELDETTSPILVLDEDGDFRVAWKDDPGEKNILWGDWTEGLVAGQFYLVPVPETITPAPGLFTSGS